MNIYLNADTGNMESTLKTLIDNKPLTYPELKIRCELLEAQAVINESAVGAMSREICDLNKQLLDILDELRVMQ